MPPVAADFPPVLAVVPPAALPPVDADLPPVLAVAPPVAVPPVLSGALAVVVPELGAPPLDESPLPELVLAFVEFAPPDAPPPTSPGSAVDPPMLLLLLELPLLQPTSSVSVTTVGKVDKRALIIAGLLTGASTARFGRDPISQHDLITGTELWILESKRFDHVGGEQNQGDDSDTHIRGNEAFESETEY